MRYIIREPVELRFSLHNRIDRTLYVLTWYTPLEGLAGEILRLTRDGNPVPYRGILARRGDPTAEEYVAIQAGAMADAVVDLAESYDLSRAGRYQVVFTSRLYDVVNRLSLVPKPWGILTNVIGSVFLLSLPSKRFRCTWMAIITHSGQSVFFIFLILGIVLGLA